jgi:hypothetical protein
MTKFKLGSTADQMPALIFVEQSSTKEYTHHPPKSGNYFMALTNLCTYLSLAHNAIFLLLLFADIFTVKCNLQVTIFAQPQSKCLLSFLIWKKETSFPQSTHRLRNYLEDSKIFEQ